MFGQSGGHARQTVRIRDSRASAPTLLSVESPDTVRIPETGTRLIQITARATHPNGVSFIREVLATRTDNRNITFQLLDDGDRNGLSGDQTAGDGIFTATLQVPSTNSPATRTFEYQAIDRAERRSNIITRSIVFLR
ncbi:MAG: choice-of-anchor X domain-containing protein [Chloroherpetonaceae bacterium]|nr:choice-of-anchor X domain-containing protein [Chloroherpetonaceae bacterium]